jgi:hypothetical protein
MTIKLDYYDVFYKFIYQVHAIPVHRAQDQLQIATANLVTQILVQLIVL